MIVVNTNHAKPASKMVHDPKNRFKKGIHDHIGVGEGVEVQGPEH